MIEFSGVDSTVTLEERERYLKTLPQPVPAGLVVLATCDRIEVYQGSGAASPTTVRHLFRVVSGLESPMLGENQIQAQVKQAYADAVARGNLPPGFHRLFQAALHAGKRVRSETRLGQGAVGHGQTVIQLLKELTTPLKELDILLIGVNKLNRSILRFLIEEGHDTFYLTNRTLQKACDLIHELEGGQAFPLEQLADRLAHADVVISATAAPHLILTPDLLPDQGGPRWFFDLAVPRDIDPEIGRRPGVNLFNVTDLEKAAQLNLARRSGEVEQAEAIIEDEVQRYLQKASE